jgi:hypothetical protein
MEPVLGSEEDLKDFIANAIQRLGGSLKESDEKDVFILEPGDSRDLMVERLGDAKFPLRVSFDGLPKESVIRLGRNHPAVSVISENVLSQALNGESDNFARCSAIYTDAVQTRTAVLVLRIRYLLKEKETQQFAEEVVVVAFKREGNDISWIEPLETYGIDLLRNANTGPNMSDVEKSNQVDWALGMLEGDWFKGIVEPRSKTLSDSHSRLRKIVGANRLIVEPHTPPDVLGCYVLVPLGAN